MHLLFVRTENEMLYFSAQTTKSYVVIFKRQLSNLQKDQTIRGKVKFAHSMMIMVSIC